MLEVRIILTPFLSSSIYVGNRRSSKKLENFAFVQNWEFYIAGISHRAQNLKQQKSVQTPYACAMGSYFLCMFVSPSQRAKKKTPLKCILSVYFEGNKILEV